MILGVSASGIGIIWVDLLESCRSECNLVVPRGDKKCSGVGSIGSVGGIEADFVLVRVVVEVFAVIEASWSAAFRLPFLSTTGSDLVVDAVDVDATGGCAFAA